MGAGDVPEPRIVDPANLLDQPCDQAQVVIDHGLDPIGAIQAGLATPDTLYSNDAAEARAFIGRHGGQVVYKTLRPFSWRNDETAYSVYTSLVTEDLLIQVDVLQQTPGIFQEVVPKAHELRLTMVGCRPFCARVLSQETTHGTLDWRKAYDELKMETCDVPRSLCDACGRLMEKLGIVFGCFDFIVTPEGKYVFLEVNEMGQFLFVERMTGLPLLDAFSEFLRQGRTDFAWDENRVRVRYCDIECEALNMVHQAAEAHVNLPDATEDEQGGIARNKRRHRKN
jgi:hypothetical protein